MSGRDECEHEWQYEGRIDHVVINGRREETQMPTRHRTFRIPDDIYDPAQQRAEHEGTTVTAVVQECLQRYGQAADNIPAGLMSRAFALDPYGTGALLGALARHVGAGVFGGFVQDAEELAARHLRRYGQEEEE